MHAWGLRLRSARVALAICRAPQYCLPVSLTPSAPLILAFSELTISGYPACMCLFPTLQVRRYRRPHMGRGQDGSLLLSCMTLSFTTSRRFIPTLSRLSAYPTFSKKFGGRNLWPQFFCSLRQKTVTVPSSTK